MHFEHSPQIWTDFPQLAAGVLHTGGITTGADVEARAAPVVERHIATATARLAAGTEADLPEIQAWRRAFATLGLKPTQYRCASEALLRRLRREAALPRVHPLVDLCNAVSAAFAIPVAALDLARVSGNLAVRRASGMEEYHSFAGEVEHPEPGEVTFVDDAGRAHARRWTNRQSAASAVRAGTRTVLIVTEALHDTARRDVEAVVTTLAEQIGAIWSTAPTAAVLTPSAARFTTPS